MGMIRKVEDPQPPPPSLWTFVAGCFLLGFPILAFVPYRWFVFVYARDSIVIPDLGREHQNVHLGVWWLLTFVPASSLCLLMATIAFIYNWRRSVLAKILFAISVSLLLLASTMLLLICSGA
jgi:hypothetical protein